MDRPTAELLLRNLLERTEDTPASPLTYIEREALQLILGETLSGVARDPRRHLDSSAHSQSARMPLSFPDLSNAVSNHIVMCIDFGTSTSKAYAVDGQKENDPLIHIKLDAGREGVDAYLLPSEIIIEDEKIYFGHDAVSRRDPERMIYSPKQYFTGAAKASQLRNEKLNKNQDPSQSLSVRDIIVLYLAYINLRAETVLRDELPNIEIARRFTHPAWSEETREENKGEMRLMFAEAIVIGRTFSEHLFEGLSLPLAVKVLKEVRRAENRPRLPNTLVLDAVREATAAGAGALLESRVGQREGYILVDVGAGTTDIAGFHVIARADSHEVNVIEVGEAADYLRLAGNQLDQILAAEILKRAGFSSGSTELATLASNLRGEGRALKEQLFIEGKADHILPNDGVISLTLAEFLELDGVRTFSERLKEKIGKSVDAMGDAYKKLNFVVTGGGASLPMIQSLTEGVFTTPDGRNVQLIACDAMSEELGNIYPDIKQYYHRLAVAIGGALPELPEEKFRGRASLTSDPGPRVISPNYKS